MRDIAIINHNFLIAFAAVLPGIGAATTLALDLTVPTAFRK